MIDEKYRYHVTKENPRIKMYSILEAEKDCPLCGCENTKFTKWELERNVFQYKYLCPNCESEWVGNAFNGKYEFIR